MSIQERKNREKERRRQQILAAAKMLISRKGFNNTTMKDIAAEAELSPGTLYIYFKNKEELFASFSLKTLQFLNIRVEQVIKTETTNPEKQLENLIEAIYDAYNFDPQTVVYMFHIESDEIKKSLSSDLLLKLKNLLQKSVNAIAGVFEEGIKNGLFINKSPTLLAGILLALLSGVVLWEESKKTIYSEKNSIKQKLGFAYECFSQGLRNQPIPKDMLQLSQKAMKPKQS